MNAMMNDEGGSSTTRWLRGLVWGGAAVLLSLPAIAMHWRVEGVDWTASDFVAMGVILAIACGSFELVMRLSGNWLYRAAGAVAIGAGFLLVWANLAVGIIGDGIGAANLMFFGVVLVAIAGTAFVRGRAAGMVRAMLATAAALLLAIVIGLVAFGASALEAGLTLVFVAGWLASAGVFHLSARAPAPSRT